ncbi:glycosyltransferase [Rhodocyclaceae bacterium SMB388]
MKRRLLVLSSTYPRWAGDPEPGFVHELCQRLVTTFDVHVLCPHAPDAARNEVIDDVSIHRFRYAPMQLQTLVQDGGILANLKHHPWKWMLLPGFFIGQAWKTAHLLRTLRPAAIHAHWIIPQGFVLAVLHSFGSRMPPILLTSHGGDLFGMRGPVLARIKRWALGKASAVTVVSAAMLAATGRLGVPTPRVSVIPMGVDFATRFTPAQATVGDPYEILFVGRLVEKKGVRHLIEAMPAILAAEPRAHLSIVGHGPECNALQELAGTIGVADRLTFIGPLPQSALPALYQRASVFVAPFVQAKDGDREGLGLVTVEAIACGCPVVISALPAVMDLLDPVEDATMLCEPANVAMLAERVVGCLRAPEVARQRVMCVRRRLLERMSWPTVAARYEALITSLMDSRDDHLMPRAPATTPR